MQDPSHLFDLHHSSGQCQILDPLRVKDPLTRDQTGNLIVPSQIHFHCMTTGTPSSLGFKFSWSISLTRILFHWFCISMPNKCPFYDKISMSLINLLSKSCSYIKSISVREFPGGLVVKDLVLSLLWLGFDPWCRNFCMLWAWGKK